ncbi:MAG: DUF4331 family protein [Erythrobacter sp.]|nr:MAG: DUF4331 family protein [Erythrobacter sp.]
MSTSVKLVAGSGGIMLAAAAALWAPGIGLIAADHLDPPQRTDPSVDQTPDRAADIADFYAWHTDDKINFVLTFSGPQATDQPATYDPDVLYSINISNAGAATSAEQRIDIRFGRGAGANQFGVQVNDVPGTGGPIEGSVESNITQEGVMVRAGLFDDPFFFDLQGFRQTRDTGALSFSSTRDFFAGQNLTAVVISIPRDRIENGTNPINAWATSARFGGQL